MIKQVIILFKTAFKRRVTFNEFKQEVEKTFQEAIKQDKTTKRTHRGERLH